MAIGIDRASCSRRDGRDWDPVATAAALIVDAVRASRPPGGPFDLILVRQRGGRHRRLPGRDPGGRRARPAGRDRDQGARGPGRRRRRAPAESPRRLGDLRAAVARGGRRQGGLNLPRYPSVPGRLRAKKKEIETSSPDRASAGRAGPRHGSRLPIEQEAHVEILGQGPEAAPRVVEVLREIGVL